MVQLLENWPIVVNLYGGPGSGKSTTAAGLFHLLKLGQFNCELVHEEAKKQTWLGSQLALDCQPYIFGKQLMKLWRVKDKVDIIVTDSPILLSCIYGESWGSHFITSCLGIFQKFNNVNFFLERTKEYSEVGRNQDEAAAREIDTKIAGFLLDSGFSYSIIGGDENAAATIYGKVVEIFEKNRLTRADSGV